MSALTFPRFFIYLIHESRTINRITFVIQINHKYDSCKSHT